MEDALQKLMREAGSTKYASIASSAHKALDILESFSRAPASEYRQTSLEAVRHALDIGNPKIVGQAIVILQKLVRDDRFHSKEPEKDETLWMSSQVMAAVHGTGNLTEDQKQEVLKVILSLSCHAGWVLNGHLVVNIFALCLGLYGSSGTGTKAAALATCSQTVTEYAKHLNSSKEESDGSGKYNDSIPVFQFITSRLDGILKQSCNETASELGLLLQCLLSLITRVPQDIVANPHFKRYVCTKLCPTLMSYLDSADKQQRLHLGGLTGSSVSTFWTTSKKSAAKKQQKPDAVKLGEAQLRVINQTIIGLATLLGPDAEMRPVLESMFHRLLICSQPKHRVTALQCLKELLGDPDKVMQLAFYETVPEEMDFDSMPLFKLISDSIEECSRLEENQRLIVEATQCISNLLDSLDKISQGQGLNAEKAQQILKLYPCLQDSDYTGPNYYDGTARLPKEYSHSMSKDESESEGENESNENSKSPPSPPSTVNGDRECGGDDERQEEVEEKVTEDSGANEDNKELSEEKDVEKVKDSEGEESVIGKEGPDNDTQSDGEGKVETDSNDKEAVVDQAKPDSNKEDGRNGSEDGSEECSEDTEGPEEGFDEEHKALKLDTYLNEAESAESESAVFHRSKIPKSLVENDNNRRRQLSWNSTNDGDDEGDDDDEVDDAADEERNDSERENARMFVKNLKDQLGHVVNARGSVEMDSRLQEFASNFCHQYSTHSPCTHGTAEEQQNRRVIILNADGVYMACYYALHLNMQLAADGFYNKVTSSSSPPPPPPCRQQFLDNILSSGLLIYVSPVWLSEVFDIVTEVDAFGFCIKSSRETRLNGLRNLLMDLDGFGKAHKGSQLLADCKLFRQDTVRMSMESADPLIPDAGKRISRRIVTTCWNSFLSHLNTSLGPFLGEYCVSSSASGIGSLFRSSSSIIKRIKHGDERLSLGVECLHTAMALCSALQLHDHCGELLEPMTSLLCPDPFSRGGGGARNGGGGGSSDRKFNLVHLVYIEDVLRNGLELASQSQDCWKFVMRCVNFVLHMEGDKGSKGVANNRKSVTKIPKDKDELDLNFESPDDPEMPLSQSTFALPPGFENEEDEKGLQDYFGQYMKVKDKYTYLTAEEAATANALLLKRVERLFDDAATKLNLKSLMGFMSELSFCSHKELLTIFPRKATASSTKIKVQQQQKGSKSSTAIAANAILLFHRISEVMLKCVKSGRPLLHMVRAWAVVGPHLMEAACHREDTIAKKAVAYIHDIIMIFLQNTTELPYFHFNETLFKPFENLVCLELCNTDIQDQIVSSICEFVETSTSEISSGWRSLFGTLKEVRFPLLCSSGNDAQQQLSSPSSDNTTPRDFHYRAVLDVFEAFLATENPQIFANAALDYISCLIHHVRGGEERQQLEELLTVKDTEKLFVVPNGSGSGYDDLTHASLRYLVRCNNILRRMHLMSSCPVFQGAHRVRILKTLAVVDPVIPDFELVSFDANTDTLPDFPYSYKILQTSSESSEDDKRPTPLSDDRARGLLKVWYLMIDGLASAVMNCPREYQSSAVDTLFEILSVLQKDGEENEEFAAFGLFCTNHLLLPMLQSWLRRSQRTFQGWAAAGPNFKHCMGKTTEFVLNWLTLEQQKQDDAEQGSQAASSNSCSSLALKQLLLLLVECTVVPVESIARLGCSCLKHIAIIGGTKFSPDHWSVFCLSLCRASQLTLYPLHQMMAPFYQGSSNFYGDVGEVKVAARRDSCKRESHRLLQLAQQVLQLDQQRSELPAFPENPEMEERSFLFLLQPPGSVPSAAAPAAETSTGDVQVSLKTDSTLRVPLRSLLTGLTAHHILLQLFGTLLLQGTNYSIPSLANLLLHSSIMPCPLTPGVETPTPTPSSAAAATTITTGPAGSSTNDGGKSLLDHLTSEQIRMLLCSLRSSYQTCLEFDSRPGLKFLVQKVSQLGHAANLYKQAGAAWSITAIAIFNLCVRRLPTASSQQDEEDKETSSSSSFSAIVDEIKKELELKQKSRNTHQFSDTQQGSSTVGSGNSSPTSYFVDLHDLFLDLSELYADIVVDKDGHHSGMDAMSKQQLYFLTIEPDDFHEMVRRPRTPKTSKTPKTPKTVAAPETPPPAKTSPPKTPTKTPSPKKMTSQNGSVGSECPIDNAAEAGGGGEEEAPRQSLSSSLTLSLSR